MSQGATSRLRADLASALKAGETHRATTLRLLLSELRNEEIERRRELSEDEVVALVARGVKSRQESIEHFRRGGREDLVAKEEAEIAVLRGYLPAPLADAELDALVEEALAATGASSPREMGRVMGWLMPRVRGRSDGAEVSRRVKQRLSGPAAPEGGVGG